MTLWFGDPAAFALALGERAERAELNDKLRVLDVWVGGDRVTTEDNLAFIPQMRATLEREARGLATRINLDEPFPNAPLAEQHMMLEATDDGSAEKFWFLHWGPTTDNCSAFVYRFGSELAITCRNRFDAVTNQPIDNVLQGKVSEDELVQLLLRCASSLEDP
jgi:hypothetical protein